MATVVLQVAGAAIGGAIGGPMGAMVGRAIGAYAGHAIDQKLFSKEQVIRGGRLEESRLMGSSEGTNIPLVYGRVRIGGQIIWATRFHEIKKKKKSGGKGGGGQSATHINYSYYANFAVGICEGEVSRISRIWVDGSEIDQTKFRIRKYYGSKTQEPDPLIEAKQGFGKTPAFRGTCYVVFEFFPLKSFGNRIPQITFEVIRSISKCDNNLRSVNIIPGATEMGCYPMPKKVWIFGRTTVDNRNTLKAASDWADSLDELQELCPRLDSASLVVSWFGNDLRAGQCVVEPRVTSSEANNNKWSVGDLKRVDANEVTKIDFRPVYGGTPSDASVIAAIKDLHARGIKPTFYPFIMMDIPKGNELDDPYGNTEQAPFPWRGRISCHPAPANPASIDQSEQARLQVENFLGTAQPEDFTIEEEEEDEEEDSSTYIAYSGEDGYGYRRMILHYAHLCALAGGVDTFLIGAEMPGLTRVRDENGNFPFVDGLGQLASEVKQILGPQTKVSYAADWSEYFGYHPKSASHDVFFNLDPLWSSPHIDFIGIDNYMPLSDWRDGGDPYDPARKSLHAVENLQSEIAGGEGMDWYYASADDRKYAIRTPITDGMDEPWIWAYKDLVSWWGKDHHNRKDGVRASQKTQWVPKSKPIRFTELGCPAVNRGTNQPNVFVDAKSSESSLPYFSRGGRDDLILLRYIEAHQRHWSNDNPDADLVNPPSPLYEGRMVDEGNLTIWAWDSRPYPEFPQKLNIWSDGTNWFRGHWLNGRIGTCPIDELMRQIFIDIGMSEPVCKIDGHVTGYVIGLANSLREALEPLLATFNISVAEDNGTLSFYGKSRRALVNISSSELVQEKDQPALITQLNGEHELPGSLVTSHSELETLYSGVTSSAIKRQTASQREFKIDMPAVLSRDSAMALTEARLRDFWLGRESHQLKLANNHIQLEAGDLITIDEKQLCQISSLGQGKVIEIEAAGFGHFEENAIWSTSKTSFQSSTSFAGPPLVKLMNLPLHQNEYTPQPALYAVVFAEPWAGPYVLLRSSNTAGFEPVANLTTPATVIELLEPLSQGPIGRWDYGAELLVKVSGGELESVDRMLVFEGRNSLAIETPNNGYEIVQFQHAELIGSGIWRLSKLLRSQLGTNPEMADRVPEGSWGVVIDEALVSVPVPAAQQGMELNYRVVAEEDEIGSPDSISLRKICTGISARPLSPVHLRIAKHADHLSLSWIRRSRLDSDRWEISHPPLDAPNERYLVKIKNASGTQLRQMEVESSSLTYSHTDRLADTGSADAQISFEVAQISANGTAGPAASIGPVA